MDFIYRIKIFLPSDIFLGELSAPVCFSNHCSQGNTNTQNLIEWKWGKKKKRETTPHG